LQDALLLNNLEMSVQLLSTLPTGGAVQLMISAANKSAETDLLLKKNTIS